MNSNTSTSKLLFVTFFNCHGKEYVTQLQNNSEFNKKYTVVYIALYDYLDGYKYELCNELISEHSELIRNADVLLIQSLKHKQRFLDTQELIDNYCKSDCTVIKIPHYTFSGYEYTYNSLKDNQLSFSKTNAELTNHLNSIYKNNSTDIRQFFNSELNHLKELDKISSICVHNFVENTFNKTRLFYARGYPANSFFYKCAVQILNILNIHTQSDAVFSGSFAYLKVPILLSVANALNIEFCLYTSKLNGANMIDYFLAQKRLNTCIIKKRNFGMLNEIHNERIQLELNV